MARLAGNFAPVAAETTIFDLAVDGHVPEELTERFLRIGPSPIGIPDPQRFHWFTGTGMAHGVRPGGGCAEWYRNRIAPHFPSATTCARPREGTASSAIMWTGTRVPRNTGSPTMILPETDDDADLVLDFPVVSGLVDRRRVTADCEWDRPNYAGT